MKKKGQPKRKATLMMLVAFVFGSVITTCMHPGVGRCVLVQQVKGNATADMVVVVMMWIDSRTLRIYAYVICTLYLYIGCSIQDYRHIHVHISAYVRIASTIWNCRDFLHHQKPVGWNNKKGTQTTTIRQIHIDTVSVFCRPNFVFSCNMQLKWCAREYYHIFLLTEQITWASRV